MRAVELEIRVDRVGDEYVMSLVGVADVSTLPTLHSALLRHLRAHPDSDLLVDLDEVIAIDDSALGVLLGAAGRSRESGRDLVVVCSDERRRDRLSQMRFDRAVEVRSSMRPSAAAHDLFHIALADDWDDAQHRGEYRVSTRGMTLDEVGFIHCSRLKQVEQVANTLYGDLDDLLLLTIDESLLVTPVRDEPPAPGVDELFPHLYGPLPLAAVVQITPWLRPDGELWKLATRHP